MNATMRKLIQKSFMDKNEIILKGKVNPWFARLYETEEKQYIERFSILGQDRKTALVLLYPTNSYECTCIVIAIWNKNKSQWEFSDNSPYVNANDTDTIKKMGSGLFKVTIGIVVNDGP